jgi:hypothetical protein
MSTEVRLTPQGARNPAVIGARRAALRLAFGVTACFTVVEALAWDATFVAPLLAAQMLIKLQRPPSLAQGLGLLVLVALSTGMVLALTTALISMPAVLILALGS